jgi:general stress protein YciG
MPERKKGQMSVEEAGRKGGLKGGRKTAETHGHKFYEKIGRKGGQRVKRLIQEGKAREKE